MIRKLNIPLLLNRINKKYLLSISFFSLFLISLNSIQDVWEGALLPLIEIPVELKFKNNTHLKIDIDFTIPEGHHISIAPADSESFTYFTKFSLDGELPFRIVKIKYPKGIKEKGDFILRGKGRYTIVITNTDKLKKGNIKIKMTIKTQMCNEKNNVCYPPQTVDREILLKID